jgi:TonB family protein
LVLSFTVNHEGTPQNINVKRSLYPSLDQAAVESVGKWRFEPAMKDGQPVSMWMEAEVNFTLNQEPLTGVAIMRDGRTEYQGQEYRMRRGSDAERRAEEELEVKKRAVLAREAKISMDQAIQIATSKVPGKVLECSLVGERWSGPGELAKPSQVFYRVVILSEVDTTPVTYHVLVNALDGSVVRSEKEERKRELVEHRLSDDEKKNIEGGVLNGKAVSLPAPNYPAIARAAHAEGDVVVRVTIDEGGNIIEAQAVSGHPLLQAAAVSAAREAKFTPTRLEGKPVQIRGSLVYNFVKQ